MITPRLSQRSVLLLVAAAAVAACALLPLTVSAQPPANCCSYRFAQGDGNLQVSMPRAQPNSPGDVRLNPNNDIVSSTGAAVPHGCNGNAFEYWDEATQAWVGTYRDTNNAARPFQHVFYASQFSLMISTLQTNQAGLPALLNGKIGRVNLRCNNNERVPEGTGCVQFTIGETSPTVAERPYTPGNCVVPEPPQLSVLQQYVAEADAHYKWDYLPQYNLVGPGYTAYFLNVTSQKWLDETIVNKPIWFHSVYVIVPATIRANFSRNALMWVANKYNDVDVPTNNVWKASETNLFVAGTLALQMQTVVAVVYQVPNQYLKFAEDPLQKNRREDEGVAFSWKHFMDHPDAPVAWAIRLPMAKAVVKAMDATEEFLSQTLNKDVSRWLVAGPSKRGWTSYAVAAAVPQRIIGFSSLVLDQADFKKVVEHQYKTLGGWSYAANDYIVNNIFQRMEDPAFERLMALESPFSYLDVLNTIPKLILSCTGDEFAAPDDINLYWDRFGPDSKKTFRLLPNNDHSMEKDVNGVLETLVGWMVLVQADVPKPNYTWNIAADGTLTVTCDQAWAPAAVKLWQANTIDGNRRRDFRLTQYNAATGAVESHNVRFTSSSVAPSSSEGGKVVYTARVEPPSEGWVGFYFELQFQSIYGSAFKSNTGVSILPQTYPYEMCAGGDACNGPII